MLSGTMNLAYRLTNTKLLITNYLRIYESQNYPIQIYTAEMVIRNWLLVNTRHSEN
jgi:hypothetical protein